MYDRSPAYTENGLQYTFTESGAYIIRYEGDAEKLVIPDTLGGKPVIGLKKRAFANYEARPNPYIREIDYRRVNQLKLKEIILPETLEIIEDEAFGGLATLETLIIPEKVTSIGGFAFRGCSLKRISLPEGILSIPSYAFHNCGLLEEVILPDGLKYICSYAFENCKSLKQIDLPDSVIEIEEDAFYGAGLVRFVFPSGVRAIEQFAFCGCRDLEEVILPEQLLTIALGAFDDCTSLKRIRIPSSTKNIGWPFVYGIPGSGKNSPNGHERHVFTNCENLEAINVDPDNQYLCSVDGVLYNKDKTVLILYPQGKKDESCAVPETVTLILSEAFAGNPYMTEVIS